MQNNIRVVLQKFLTENFKSYSNRIHLNKAFTASMDLTTNAKRFCSESDQSVNGSVRLGTHDGVFHCDEILACFLLRQLPQYSNAQIIRTRDPTRLDACDVVVDVGGVYEPSHHRYDHHQREFSLTLSSLLPNKESKIKLSSAGLIYTHFGHEIIGKLLGWDKGETKTDVIFDKVYDNFVQEIDAIDNGLSALVSQFVCNTNLFSLQRGQHL